MANLIKYSTNVIKSLGYSTVDKIKEMNPTLSALAEDNAETTKELFSAIKDYKGTTARIKTTVQESVYYKTIAEAKNNLFDDLKTGKFYNREREDKIQNEIMGNFLGDDSVEISFGDSDFGFGDEDEDTGSVGFGSDEDFGDDDGDVAISFDGMDTIGEKVTHGVASATIKSADYVTKSARMNTVAITSEINKLGGAMTSGFGSVSSTLANLQMFNEKAIKVHIDNSTNFYKNSTALDEERNKLLKELVDIQKANMIITEKDTSTKKSLADMISSDGSINIKEYLKMVGKNATEAIESWTGMMDVTGDGSGLRMLAASPLKFATDAIVGKLIPEVIKNAMHDLNDTLSGFFGSLALKARNYVKNSGNDWLGNLLGINTEDRTGFSTSGYYKGPMPWNGKAEKALTEVIPNLLSSINQGINGGKAQSYDYNKGEFRTHEDIQQEWNNKLTSIQDSVSYDLLAQVREAMDYFKMSNEQKDDLIAEMRDAFRELQYNGTMLNLNKLDDDEYYNGQNTSSFNTLNMLVKSGLIKRSDITKFNSESMRGKLRYNKEMAELDKIGGGIYASLEDNLTRGSGSGIASMGANIFTIVNDKDPLRRSAYDYLSCILEVLERIEEHRSLGNNKKKSKVKQSNRRVTNQIRTSSDRETETQSSSQDSNTSKSDDEAAPGSSDIEDNGDGKITWDEFLQQSADERREYVDNAILTREAEQNVKEHGRIGTLINDFASSFKMLLTKPSQFIKHIATQADMRLYEMLYGWDDVDENGKPIGFLAKMKKNTKELFGRFGDWIENNILNPVWESIKNGPLGQLFGKIFSKDEDGKSIVDKAVDSAKTKAQEVTEKNHKKRDEEAVNNFAKDLLITDKSKVKYHSSHNIFEYDGKLYSSDKKELSESESARFRNIFNKSKDNESVTDTPEETSGFARGTHFVPETGVYALTKGEMVVPRERNPFYNGIQTSKYSQSLTEDIAIDEFLRTGKIGKYNKGTDGASVDEEGTVQVSLSFTSLNKLGEIITNMIHKVSSKGEEFVEEHQEDIDHLNKEASKYVETDTVKKIAKGFGDNVSQGISNLLSGAKSFVHELGGSKKEKDSIDKQIQQATTTASGIVKDIKRNPGGLLVGGGVGAIASLLTGIGGPLVGAFTGAAVSLLKDSGTLRQFLFGENFETGEWEGGLIKNRKVLDFIKKRVPGMAASGAIGSLVSLIPGVPGGPITGLMLGATVDYLRHNERFNEFLFGRDVDGSGHKIGGILGDTKPITDRLKKALPNMTVGALAGLVAGPFGVVGNIALGSAIGYVTTSNKFSELLLGKKVKKTDENGNEIEEREGGLAGLLRDSVIKPVRTAFKPLSKQLQLGIKGTFDFIKSAFGKMIKSYIGLPINRFITDKLLKPAGAIVGGLFKAVSAPAKAVITAPFKLIGAAGEHYRRKQIQSGTADYMTAAERNVYRKENGLEGSLGRNDMYAQFDSALEGMDIEELNQMRRAVSLANNSDEVLFQKRKDIQRNIAAKMNNYNLDYDTARNINKLAQTGSYDEVSKYIHDHISNPDTAKDILDMVDKDMTELHTIENHRADSTNYRTQLYNKLREQFGIDVDDKNLGNLAGLLDREKLAREDAKDPVSEELQKQREEKQDQHKELMSYIEEIAKNLAAINDPEKRKELNEFYQKKERSRSEDAMKRTGLLGGYSFSEIGTSKLSNDQVDIINEYIDLYDDGMLIGVKSNSEIQSYLDVINKAFGTDYSADSNNYPDSNTLRSLLDGKTKKVSLGNPTQSRFRKAVNFVKNIGKGESFKDRFRRRWYGSDVDDSEIDAYTAKRDSIIDSRQAGDKYTYSPDGKTRTWTTDDLKTIKEYQQSDGTWKPDLQDSATKEYIHTKKEQSSVLGKIHDFASDIKNKVTGIFDGLFHKEDGSDTLFAKIMKGIVKGAGILTAASAYVVIRDWWKEDGKAGLLNWWSEGPSKSIAEFANNHWDKIGGLVTKVVNGVTNVYHAITGIPNYIGGLWSNVMLPFVTDKLVPFYKGGFDFLIGNGVPHLIRNLIPAIFNWDNLKAIGSAIWDVFTGKGGTTTSGNTFGKTNNQTMSLSEWNESYMTGVHEQSAQSTQELLDEYKKYTAENVKGKSALGLMWNDTVSQFNSLRSGETLDSNYYTGSMSSVDSDINDDMYNKSDDVSTSGVSMGATSTTVGSNMGTNYYPEENSVPAPTMQEVSNAFVDSKFEQDEATGAIVHTPSSTSKRLGRNQLVPVYDERTMQPTGEQVTLEEAIANGLPINTYMNSNGEMSIMYGDMVNTDSSAAKFYGLDSSNVTKHDVSTAHSLTSRYTHAGIKYAIGWGGKANVAAHLMGVTSKVTGTTLKGVGKVVSKMPYGTLAGKAISTTGSVIKTTGSIASNASKVGKAITTGTRNTGLLAKFGNVITKFADSICNILFNNKVVNWIAKKLGKSTSVIFEKKDKMLKWIIEKLGKLCNSNAILKKIPKLFAKLSSVILIASIVKGLIDGFANANSILGVTGETSVGEKIFAAFVSVFNETIFGGLFDTEDVMDFVIGILGFWMDTSWFNNLKQRRLEAERELGAYNNANGTNYTLRDYNQNVKGGWFGKAQYNVRKFLNYPIQTIFGGSNKDEDDSVTSAALEDASSNVEEYTTTELNTVAQLAPVDGAAISVNNNSQLILEQLTPKNRHTDTVLESAKKGNLSVTDSKYLDMSQFGSKSNDTYADALMRLGNAYDRALAAPILLANEKVENAIAFSASSSKNNKKKYNEALTSAAGAFGAKGSSDFVSQVDGKYANKKYGNSTIGESGCGPATAVMAIANSAKSALSMNEATKIAEQGGYINADGSTDIRYFRDALGSRGISTNYSFGSDGAARQLTNGSAILMGRDVTNTSKSVSPFGPGNHYVLAKGVDRNGNIIVSDPENREDRVYSPKILKNVTASVGIGGRGSRRYGFGARGAGEDLASALSKLGWTVKTYEDYHNMSSSELDKEIELRNNVIGSYDYLIPLSVTSDSDKKRYQAARDLASREIVSLNEIKSSRLSEQSRRDYENYMYRGGTRPDELAKLRAKQGTKYTPKNIWESKDYIEKAHDPEYVRRQNLGSFSPIETKEEIDKFAKWWDKRVVDKNLKGCAGYFLEASSKSGLDPRYIAAHFALETGWGDSRIWRDKFNGFGIRAYDNSAYSSAMRFASALDGIVQGAIWIATNYYHGKYRQTNLYKMRWNDNVHQYATAETWDTSIAEIMANNELPLNKAITYDEVEFYNTGLQIGTNANPKSSSGGFFSKLTSIFGQIANSIFPGLFDTSDDIDTDQYVHSDEVAFVDGTRHSIYFTEGSKSLNRMTDTTNVINVASKYIGRMKYKFGATNYIGLETDCSSFVQGVFKEAKGVDIGRSTINQLDNARSNNVLSLVHSSNVMPGDLVYFCGTISDRPLNQPSHVGIIATSGSDPYVIHNGSSATGVVKVRLSQIQAPILAYARIPDGALYRSNSVITDTNSNNARTSKTSSIGTTRVFYANGSGLGSVRNHHTDTLMRSIAASGSRGTIKSKDGMVQVNKKYTISNVPNQNIFQGYSAGSTNLTPTKYVADKSSVGSSNNTPKLNLYSPKSHSTYESNNRRYITYEDGNVEFIDGGYGTNYNNNRLVSGRRNVAAGRSTSTVVAPHDQVNVKYMLAVIQALKAIEQNTRLGTKFDRVIELLSTIMSKNSAKGTSTDQTNTNPDYATALRLDGIEGLLKSMLTNGTSAPTTDESMERLIYELETIAAQ